MLVLDEGVLAVTDQHRTGNVSSGRGRSRCDGSTELEMLVLDEGVLAVADQHRTGNVGSGRGRSVFKNSSHE